jgi:hypothetical protein
MGLMSAPKPLLSPDEWAAVHEQAVARVSATDEFTAVHHPNLNKVPNL